MTFFSHSGDLGLAPRRFALTWLAVVKMLEAGLEDAEPIKTVHLSPEIFGYGFGPEKAILDNVRST